YWPPAWAHPEMTATIIHRSSWLRRRLFHHEMPFDAIAHGVRSAGGATSHDDLRFQLAHLELREPAGHAASLAAATARTPILLVASRDDVVVPPHHTDTLARHLPHARRHPAVEGG